MLQQTPQTLGRYQVIETLGQGAMGVVYKGFDPLIGRSVALKTIRKDLLVSDRLAESERRFRNEVMASGRLNHSGIIATYEFAEQDDTVFMVMEYASGDSLRGYLSRRESISLTEILDIMTQLLDALDYAHANGVVHRDIKPANIIVSAGGRIKITDFGIARINTSMLTQTGMIVGTPSYMAPEQYTGLAIDCRADVFSAGVVLYELLTGAKPFEGATETVAYKICHEPHRAPSLVNIRLPRGLDEVIARALAKTVDARYPSAHDFSNALRLVIEHHESQAREPTLISTLAGGAPPPRPVQELTSLSVTGWQSGVLEQMEAVIAPFVGPLARTLIKRSADKAFTPKELQDKLSLAIDDLSERAAFIQASRPLFEQLAQALPARPKSTASSVGGVGDAHRPISQMEVERATLDLTEILGPIAKVLVKKEAVHAHDVRSLYVRLAEHLSSAQEKAAFLKTRGF